MSSHEEIKLQLRAFSEARDWDQFHSPKNLAMALVVEAAELVENFQWMTEAQSAALPADKLDIDIDRAVARKMEINEQKYPVEKARGNARKYTEFDDGD